MFMITVFIFPPYVDMGQANHKLWDAVEQGDARGLEEVLTHKEADVNYERTFKANASALFDIPYLSTNPNQTSSPSLTKTPLATHEKIVNKMGLGDTNDKDTITPLHAACEKGRPDDKFYPTYFNPIHPPLFCAHRE